MRISSICFISITNLGVSCSSDLIGLAPMGGGAARGECENADIGIGESVRQSVRPYCPMGDEDGGANCVPDISPSIYTYKMDL
jgi:hypothetical protein